MEKKLKCKYGTLQGKKDLKQLLKLIIKEQWALF